MASSPRDAEYSYFVDGIWLKRSWGGEVRNVSVLVAVGVNNAGYREIPGVAEGCKEDSESWRQFLRYLRGRCLERIKFLVSDKSIGLLEALSEFYPAANNEVSAHLADDKE